MLFQPKIFISSLAFTALAKIILKDRSRSTCLPSLKAMISESISLTEEAGVGASFVNKLFEASTLDDESLKQAINTAQENIWVGKGEPFKRTSLRRYVIF